MNPFPILQPNLYHRIAFSNLSNLLQKAFAVFFFSFYFSIYTFAQKNDCEVIKHYSFYEVRSNKLYETDSILIQINNRNGEKYSKINIPFSKSDRISNLQGWIEDLNGNKIRSLSKDEISEKSDISEMSLYEDDLVKTFQLKHNQYPYRIFYTYKLTLSSVFSIANWTPVFNSDIATLQAQLTVTFPKNYAIKYSCNKVQCAKKDSSDISVRYVFASKYSPIDINEKYAVHFDDIKPYVKIMPLHFVCGIAGSSASWKDYGQWFYDLNKDLNDLPVTEKQIVDKLITGITDKKEIAKKLYYYLQDHTRYINISVGIGGFKAYPASYVSLNKYGDCKALSNYMKSLLEYAGIKSSFVLINAKTQPQKLIEELPSPQFNHVILCVPLDRDTLWIDNTLNASPFNYISSSLQNRKALIVENQNSRIINMPVFKKDGSTLIRKVNVSLSNEKETTVDATFLMKGLYFDFFNDINTEFNKDEQDEIIREYLPINNYEIINWKLNKPNRDSAQIKLTSLFNVNKLVKTIANEKYFNIFPFNGNYFERPENRKTPVNIPLYINRIDSINYLIPESLRVKSVPETIELKSRYGEYFRTILITDHNIEVIKKQILYPSVYSLNEYKGFYDFIKSITDKEKELIILSNNN